MNQRFEVADVAYQRILDVAEELNLTAGEMLPILAYLAGGIIGHADDGEHASHLQTFATMTRKRALEVAQRRQAKEKP